MNKPKTDDQSRRDALHLIYESLTKEAWDIHSRLGNPYNVGNGALIDMKRLGKVASNALTVVELMRDLND